MTAKLSTRRHSHLSSLHRRLGQQRTQLGLHTIATPETRSLDKEDGEQLIDVVAVHGLNGDCMRSWTYESSSGEDVVWLRDLLPQKLPNIRVMTFGYMATVFGNTSVAGVRDNARTLLSLLVDQREQNEDVGRPIVFVGHSLGGIIIKQALRIANNEPAFADIADSTRGIVFFGTPHRGATAAKWLSLVTAIAATAFNKPRSAFIDVLKPNSRDLIDISEDFRSIATRYALISFVEQDVCEGIGSVIVEKSSAVMELAHEEYMMLGGNHSTMCKFDLDDSRFDAIWRRIKRAAKGL